MRGAAARSLPSSLTCGRHSHSRCSSLPRCHPTQGCSEAASLPQLGTCPLPLPTDRVPLGAWSVPAALTLRWHRAGQPDKPVSPPACGGPWSSHSSVRLLRRRGPRGGVPGAGARWLTHRPAPPAGLRLPPLLEGAPLLWSRRGAHRLRLRPQVRRHVEKVSPGSRGRGGHGGGTRWVLLRPPPLHAPCGRA